MKDFSGDFCPVIQYVKVSFPVCDIWWYFGDTEETAVQIIMVSMRTSDVIRPNNIFTVTDNDIIILLTYIRGRSFNMWRGGYGFWSSEDIFLSCRPSQDIL